MKHRTRGANPTIPEDRPLNAGMETAKLPAGNPLAKVGCPICTALKEFQIYFAKHLRPYECPNFCNLHAWVIASASPAESVATMFLASVRNPRWRPNPPNLSECTFCKRLQIEKETRLTEICGELDHGKLEDWLHGHGMLCFRHSRELIQKLPVPMRQGFESAMSEKVKELEWELDDFLQKTKGGGGTGGGILGRAAEYLVAQRGIES